MEYFKVCNESKFDDIHYLFSYYAINGKAICLTISKDNLTNELNFEDNFANFETIKSFTEDADSTTIYFDKDYDLFNEMSSFIKQQYKGFIVQFFAWKSETEQNPPNQQATGTAPTAEKAASIQPESVFRRIWV